MATNINYCPPPREPVLRRCRVPDMLGKIRVDFNRNHVLSMPSDRLDNENSPISDQSKIILTPCSVKVEKCKLSSSSLVWDVEKVLLEDQTVQLLYHGVKVREGASDEDVGTMEDENIETNSEEPKIGLHQKKCELGGYLCPKCGQAFNQGQTTVENEKACIVPLLPHIL
jgi:hypothetical protein